MQPEIYSDYALNWGIRGGYYEFHIDIVEYSIDLTKPLTILTNIIFVGNEKATQRFIFHAENGMQELMKSIVLKTCAENEAFVNANAYIIDGQPYHDQFGIEDSVTGIDFHAFVTVKILGPYDKKNKIYYFGNIFTRLWEEDKQFVK